MRVYVFGGEKDELIELANSLNESGATALIGKDGDTLSDVASKIGRSFDCAIMVTEDPIKASVQANRDSKLRAAPCYDQKALKASVAEDINLFILEPSASKRLDVSVISGGASRAPERAPMREDEGIGHGILKAVSSAMPQPKPQKEAERPRPSKKEQKRAPPEEEEPPRKSRHDEGMKGRLKDIFGIEE